MTDESTFRLVTAALCVLALTISLYYRRVAVRSGEKVSRGDEGLVMMILLRLFGSCAAIVVLMYLIHPALIGWSTLQLPIWLRYVGVGLGVATIPMFHWVLHSLGRNLTDTVATRNKHTLVTHGLYRWVRHPLYLVGTLFWIGVSLVSASWFVGLMSMLSFAAVVIRTPIEEAKLIQRFGEDYRQYMKRTGRFLPSPSCKAPASSPK